MKTRPDGDRIDAADDAFTQALAWHDALVGDDADWTGFTAWLEADPAHAQAYDEVALLDDMVARNRAMLRGQAAAQSTEAAQVALPQRRWRTGLVWGGGLAVAAAAAVVLTVGLPHQARPGQDFATGTGETRQVALDDGSTIALASASKLRVGGARQDDIRLTGSALFEIRHREDRPLAIHVDGVTVSDIGTRFTIDGNGRSVRVAVAEGKLAVTVPGTAAPLTLVAGQRLSYFQAAKSIEIAKLAPQSFASWQHGRLVYDNAPIAVVASDIARYAGRPLDVNNGLAAQRFSGVLSIGDGSKLAQDFARLLGARIDEQGATLRLEPGSSD